MRIVLSFHLNPSHLRKRRTGILRRQFLTRGLTSVRQRLKPMELLPRIPLRGDTLQEQSILILPGMLPKTFRLPGITQHPRTIFHADIIHKLPMYNVRTSSLRYLLQEDIPPKIFRLPGITQHLRTMFHAGILRPDPRKLGNSRLSLQTSPGRKKTSGKGRGGMMLSCRKTWITCRYLIHFRPLTPRRLVT